VQISESAEGTLQYFSF